MVDQTIGTTELADWSRAFLCILSSIRSSCLAISIYRFWWRRGIQWLVMIFNSVEQRHSLLTEGSASVYMWNRYFMLSRCALVFFKCYIIAISFGLHYWFSVGDIYAMGVPSVFSYDQSAISISSSILLLVTTVDICSALHIWICFLYRIFILLLAF